MEELRSGSFRDLFDLSGKSALVTGAAAGFGEVICAAFAEFGCDVAAADLDYEGARRTAGRVVALGKRSVAIAADVGNPEQIRDMVKAAVDSLGNRRYSCQLCRRAAARCRGVHTAGYLGQSHRH